MTNKIRRAVVSILTFLMIVTIVPVQALADAVEASNITAISNEFIKVNVDNASGRFGITTVGGQPTRKKDQNLDMIFRGDNPETSFTTFKINGTDYIFGNPYNFAPNWFSEIVPPKTVKNQDGTSSIITEWKIEGVRIKQIITLITIDDKENAGNARISYEVKNESGASVEVGTRVLLDTSVGGNDGPAFQIGQNYMVPLQVERKLVHDPKELGFDPIANEAEYNLHKLPPYWVMRDKLDPSNPLATNVMAYGFNNLFEGGVNIVDEMTVGHWSGLSKTKWDYEINENCDFTTNTNDYGTADNAVAFYWQPKALAAGGVKTFEVVYGIGEIISPDKVFDVRFLDTVQKMDVNKEETSYANDGVFEINAEIENLPMFNMEHSKISVTCQLEEGLTFIDEDGNELGSKTQTFNFAKPISPEDAAKGIEVITYKPGDSIAVKWKVKAKGKPWPTTKQYLVTVNSPETTKNIEDKISKLTQDEAKNLKAIYESSKANFIFLPPVGKITPTYVYGLSPKEAYYSDKKFITMNISNVEGYDVGNEKTNTPANFDLYIKNVKSGERYKVPVTKSVLIQRSDAGMVGDMRITYIGGEKVDENGNKIEDVTQELPLGEYSMQVIFKDKTNPYLTEALSFETNETFLVTENEERRIRKANILAIYKTYFNLDVIEGDERSKFEETFPKIYKESFTQGEFNSRKLKDKVAFQASKTAVSMASKLVDAEFDIGEYINMEELPVYSLKAFETEEEFEEFKEGFYMEDEDEEDGKEKGEVVVEIQGMINQVGNDDEVEYNVDTSTEPAIINKSVAYTGKNIVFIEGKFPLLGGAINIPGFQDNPFFNSLYVKGDGILSIANSGFTFYNGEWTLDFFNSFEKTLGEGLVDEENSSEDENNNDEEDATKNESDDSLNGSLEWSKGLIGDLTNPFRALQIPQVYFNQHSLFAVPGFYVSGFELKFNDYILRDNGISFGGALNMKIISSEIKNVVFNEEGFAGIDASLKFELSEDLGILQSQKPKGKDKDGKDIPGNTGDVGGEINIVHYVQDIGGTDNEYGISFNADLKNFAKVNCELSFKQVDDGRILPDVIALGFDLPDPGISVAAATYITGLRAAIRELADTIASGGNAVPLTIEAGADITFGMDPATFIGSIDLTSKRTGLKIEGKLDFKKPGSDDTLAMLTEALIQTQWIQPWFIRAKASIDVCGWDLIIGKASIYIGQNLELNRTDFEGYVGAKIKVPNKVPIVGGMNLASVNVGANNDKLWGSVGILFVSLGITYYWGGGVEFGTDGNIQNKGALTYLLVQDPELGPQILAIGEGIKVAATSWETEEIEKQPVKYLSAGEGVDIIDDGSQNIGIGGIQVKNNGKTHLIPMSKVSGDSIIEVEYFGTRRPELQLKKSDGSSYNIIYNETNDPKANSFEQILTGEDSYNGTDVRRVYITIPKSEINGDTWTLNSNDVIKTKLMDLPVLPKLSEVSLVQEKGEANKFNIDWKVQNANSNDKISLYLTKDSIAETPNTTESADPGLLIAKDLPVGAIDSSKAAVGSKLIDVTKVDIAGVTSDIRGMLAQGDYYIRAELRSDSQFSTKTTVDKFKLIDPLAPNRIDDVKVEPAGNGMFELSFKPVVKKQNQEAYEYNYLITALDSDGNMYKPFGEVSFTEEELKNMLSDDKYKVKIGGWQKIGRPQIDKATGKFKTDAKGNILFDDTSNTNYSGLEVGKEYSIGVTTLTIPTAKDDKNQNMRLSDIAYAEKRLLPVPSAPRLKINGNTLAKNRFDLTTNKKVQEIALSSDKSNSEVEAFYDGKSIGKVILNGSENSGTLKFDNFNNDGTYAIELKTSDVSTGDFSMAMLYLTIDTLAPIIYIDAPITGDRTKNGKIKVKGTTNSDAIVEVRDGETGVVYATITPNKNGAFEKDILVNKTTSTVSLEIKATDKAGNINIALVDVTNDKFKVPQRLILTKTEDIYARKIGNELKATIEYSDGTSELMNNSKIKYEIYEGDSVAEIVDNTKIKGLSEGSAVLKATYQVSEGVSLSDMKVITVVSNKLNPSPPSSMGYIKATSFGTGIARTTSISIGDYGNSGNMTGCELAYRVYKDAKEASLPSFGQDITSWNMLPQGGWISAENGDTVIIAKRTVDSSKLAVASSSKIVASVYEYTGSGGQSPSGEKIFVDVTDGKDSSSVSQISIERITQLDGVKRDEIRLESDKIDETLTKLREEGKDTARVIIPDKNDEVSLTNITLPLASIRSMEAEDINLQIATENATLTIPKESFDGLEEKLNNQLYFRLIPMKEQEKINNLVQGLKKEDKIKDFSKEHEIKVLGRPMDIETNIFDKKVDIVLPLKGVAIPEDPIKREEFLNNLAVFIEHSDGDKVITKGEIVDYADNTLGIKFSVNKFSRFTIIYSDPNIVSDLEYSSSTPFIQDKQIKITFSKELDESTLTRDNVYVLDSKNNKVDIVMTYDKDSKTLKVSPKSFYKVSENYRLYLTRNVLSKYGEQLKQGVKYNFTVGSINIENMRKFKEYSNVPTDKKWKIEFKDTVDEKLFNSKSVKIVDEYCNELESYSTVSGKFIEVTPKKGYEKGKTYYLIIEGVISEKGEEMVLPVWIKFTV
jgi:hypothetical protein